MTGRNRRTSTSSLESVDHNQTPWRQESSVLKTVSKDLHENDWPIFELRDAVVLNKDGKTLESVLDVGSRGPFTIRGTLIIEEQPQRRQLLIKIRQSTPLEVRQVIRYSIGISPEGQPIIWVQSKGGFYELNPAPEYRDIYYKMCEAVLIYYRMMDACMFHGPKKSKKKGKSLLNELRPIFHKCSTLIGDGSTFDEMVDRVKEHASFLIAQFKQDDFDWQETIVYQWLAAEHADILKKAEHRLKTPPELPRSPSVESKAQSVPAISTLSRTRAGSAASSASRSIPPETEPRRSSPRHRSSRSRSVTQKEVETVNPKPPTPPVLSLPSRPSSSVARPVPATTDDQDAFSSVLNALEWVYEELVNGKNGLTMLAVLNKLYFSYKFPTFKNGQPGCHKIPVEELLHYNASALLEAIDKDKYGRHEVYTWLQDAAKRDFAPVAITNWPYRLAPRGVRPPTERKRIATNTPSTTGAFAFPSPEEESPSDTSRSSSRVGKTLRPPGRRAGKKSSLRLVTTSRKRPHSDVESNSESEETNPKRSHYFADGDDVTSDADNGDSSRGDDEADEEPIKIVIRADKIPSTVPHGPSETWTCDQEDCDYVVRGGDEEQCQERIRKHFEEHEAQMDRVNLAMTESRGHLPINHLLDKIKQMGEKVQQGGQILVNGVLLPPAIKRKLIV